MKAKYINIFLLIILFICCLYFIEAKYAFMQQTNISYETKMTEIKQQINAKQDDINKANETLNILTQQNLKKTELYENLEKWNNEILTYVNQ